MITREYVELLWLQAVVKKLDLCETRLGGAHGEHGDVDMEVVKNGERTSRAIEPRTG